MCGICGIIDFTTPATNEQLVRKMADTLVHRGPDDSGVEALDYACLGQRRLSIIDLSPAGHQPMLSPDEQVVISYNGEIYNFLELRKDLETRGVNFRGSSDTEVALHMYLEYGEDAFAMFNGMYSFAIWDARDQQLRLVRDRVGIKPLYYARTPNGIVFGSEVKAILRSGLVQPKMNTSRLHEYLYFGVAGGSETLFEGIYKLPPGSHLRLNREGVSVTPYWSVYDIKPCNDDIDTALEKLDHYLDQSVQRHLISDVPIGLFLSGGIDSSAIAAIASKHYPGKLQTFTAAFDFANGDSELALAKRMARQVGSEHHEIQIKGADVPHVIEELINAHDEPFSDAANIPLYLLCQQLKGQTKVVLQGDGGDEVFAGYRRYNVFSHQRFWQAIAPAAIALNRFGCGSAAHKRKMRFFQAMNQRNPAIRYAMMMTMEPSDYPPSNVLSKDLRQSAMQHDPFMRYREVYERLKHLDPAQRALYTDMLILLPDIFLEKVDKSTMAHSVEVRVPLLDSDLAGYVMSLPSRMKVRRGQKKWLLRRALRGTVPDYILDAPKKGFGVPYSAWLRTSLCEYMKSVLFDPVIQQAGLFDTRELETRISDHTNQKRDNGFLLYKSLNLALWYKKYICE